MINRYSEVDVNKILELDLVNGDDFNENSDWDLCSVYILEELTDNDKEALIHEVDFEVKRQGEVLKLIDLQGADMGGIESEEFKSLDEIIERLYIYWYDYCICIVDQDLFNKLSTAEINNDLIDEVRSNEDIYNKKGFYTNDLLYELKLFTEDTLMNPNEKSITIKSFISLEDALEEIIKEYLGNKPINFNNIYDVMVDNNIYMYELIDYENMVCVVFA